MEVLPFTFHGTVYVLDDDDGVRDSITLLLGCEGFRVTAFASGVEFLRRTMAWFGCVLTDLHMPGMSGIELIERDTPPRRAHSTYRHDRPSHFSDLRSCGHGTGAAIGQAVCRPRACRVRYAGASPSFALRCFRLVGPAGPLRRGDAEARISAAAVKAAQRRDGERTRAK
jgi:hypothetical protein